MDPPRNRVRAAPNRIGWRITGNVGVDMLDDIKTNASKVIKEITKANLTVDVDLHDLPDFLRHTVYIITTSGEIPPEYLPEQPEGEERAEAQEQAEEEDPNEVIERLFKYLLKLIRAQRCDPGVGFTIAASLLAILNPAFKDQLTAVLETHGGEVMETSLADYLIFHQELDKTKPYDIHCFEKATENHYVFASSLIFTLIGKQLNAKNYHGWMMQRTRSFSAPIGLDIKDTLLKYLKPTQGFCEGFYRDVRVYWKVRRLFFMNV